MSESSMRFFGHSVVAGLAAFLTMFLSGCPDNSSEVPVLTKNGDSPNTSTTERPAASPQTLSAEQRKRLSQCEDKLAAVFYGLSFDRLGIDTDINSQLADLNGWLTTCGPSDDATPLTNDSKVRAEFLPEPMQPFVSDDRYLLIDLFHIRNATLSKAIGKAAATDPSNDVKVMTDLFDRVIRNVTFVAANYGELPLEPSDIWRFGIGTTRDRAWVFALLLEQYQIDSVIIEMPSGFNAKPYLLVAAVTRGEDAKAYLFDPARGLPIPSLSDEGPLPTMPVTWAEAVKNDKVFRALDSGSTKYEVRSDRFDNAQLFVVGDIPAFAPRMALLQDALPPELSVQLYKGLGENSLATPPLLERLTSTLGVERERLRLWPHSLFQRINTLKPTAQATQLVQTRRNVMLAPYTLKEVLDENGQPIVADDQGNVRLQAVPSEMKNESNILTGRLAHMQGETSKALRAYLAARVPLFNIEINQVAAADAAYWVAVAQYESGRIDHAKRTLEKFLEKDFLSIWEASARRLLATIYASEGDYENAARVALAQNVDPGTIALFSRWKKQGLLDDVLEESEAASKNGAVETDDKKTDNSNANDSEKSGPMNEKSQKDSDSSDAAEKTSTASPDADEAVKMKADESSPKTETKGEAEKLGTSEDKAAKKEPANDENSKSSNKKKAAKDNAEKAESTQEQPRKETEEPTSFESEGSNNSAEKPAESDPAVTEKPEPTPAAEVSE